MRLKHTVPAFLFFGIFIISSLIITKPVFAQDDPCKAWWKAGNTKACLFQKVKEAVPEIDITRTVEDIFTEVVTGIPSQVISGRNKGEATSCGLFWLVEMGDVGSLAASLGVEVDQLQEAHDSAIDIDCDFNRDMNTGSLYNNDRTAGSLIGLGNVLDSTARNETIPVSLAYWFDDVKSNTLIINRTAFAQSGAKYPGFGLEPILGIWKALRNIAYALLAIVMVFIGLMIMVRKKISPQVAVTAENALPKVALSAVLITFSYPIGAFLVSMIFPLSFTAIAIIGSVLDEGFPAAATITPNPNVLMGIFAAIELIGGIGIASIVLLVIALAVTFIIWIIVSLKAIFIYFQLLVSIMVSPLVFAAGTIPGNEQVIGDWFKSMIAKVLAIPGMLLVVGFAWTLPFLVFGANYSSYIDEGFNLFVFASRKLFWFFVPLFMIALMAKALSIPKILENAIVGDKKKRR